MTTDLVPVGELKPRDFFVLRGERRIKLGELNGRTWTAKRSCWGDVFTTTWLPISEPVQPLPDCDSFDWQPPREPTALELAKEWMNDVRPCDKWPAQSVCSWLERIIAAMEREERK